MITFVQNKNIFDFEVDAIVNTINCVGVMGKGIALQFKHKYPANFKEYKYQCDKGDIQLGKVFVFHNDLIKKPKYIINFPTKKHWREKSQYQFIDLGLKSLNEEIKKRNITSIVIPPLGCGNGGLEWSRVKNLIINILSDSDIDIVVTEPTNNFGFLINEKHVPLTGFRAVLLKSIKLYNDNYYELSPIEIQKLVYFQSLLMDGTKLKYQKNTYGPFCPTLHNALDLMAGTYLLGMNDGSKPNYIHLAKNAETLADEFIQKQDAELSNIVEQIKKLISGFETPFGMELLGTVHWVVDKEKAASIDEVVEKVHNWNSRKQKIMSKFDIECAYNRLKECNFI